TLGIVGYTQANKNARMALPILAALRTKDPRFRLKLLGKPFDRTLRNPSEIAYQKAFYEDLERLELEDAVSFDPFTHDVPAWFEDVGYILSTSHHEGTHEAVAQGMSSAAVPVVRRWPRSLIHRGAERRYPRA